ncbi:hypothetical protein NBG4_370024 [Candidatus Sulfobium mesophilum]|uniref:Uncharacterized protein n=1 Tax=Candidatus Sulfobium mesophilum TaxID=2016548 RepID=A0A2U3QHS9_9BACT|nr:hypothetical protein NBG4_370024 [Candidatus Sulfobium mesophilum]
MPNVSDELKMRFPVVNMSSHVSRRLIWILGGIGVLILVAIVLSYLVSSDVLRHYMKRQMYEYSCCPLIFIP